MQLLIENAIGAALSKLQDRIEPTLEDGTKQLFRSSLDGLKQNLAAEIHHAIGQEVGNVAAEGYTAGFLDRTFTQESRASLWGKVATLNHRGESDPAVTWKTAVAPVSGPERPTTLRPDLLRRIAVAMILGNVGRGVTIELNKEELNKMNDGFTIRNQPVKADVIVPPADIRVDDSDPAVLSITIVDQE